MKKDVYILAIESSCDETSMAIIKNVKNEKNLLGEAGYRFVFDRGGLETEFYAAYWKDRTLMYGALRAV